MRLVTEFTIKVNEQMLTHSGDSLKWQIDAAILLWTPPLEEHMRARRAVKWLCSAFH